VLLCLPILSPSHSAVHNSAPESSSSSKRGSAVNFGIALSCLFIPLDETDFRTLSALCPHSVFLRRTVLQLVQLPDAAYTTTTNGRISLGYTTTTTAAATITHYYYMWQLLNLFVFPPQPSLCSHDCRLGDFQVTVKEINLVAEV